MPVRSSTKTLALALSVLASGYVAGGLLGFAAIQVMSTNAHDRDVEAAMTGAFVTGPIVAVFALVAWAIYRATSQSKH
jgi:hypothetical protein